MKLKTLALSLFLPLALVAHNASAEAPKSIQEMASILMNMDTKPSEEQLTLLKEIAESHSDTVNIQNMAQAMVNIEGKVRPADKQLVWSVLRGISSGESEKELAKLINAFDTKASNAQAKRLARLLPAPPSPQATSKKTD